MGCRCGASDHGDAFRRPPFYFQFRYFRSRICSADVVAAQVERPRLRLKQTRIVVEDYLAGSGGSGHHLNRSRFSSAATTSTSIPQPPNFSRFHNMNPSQLLGWIAAGWAMGGFAEEIIRAYLIYRIVDLLGDSRAAWICAVAGSSIFYVLNHQYQGFAGVFGVVVSCIGFGFLYLVSKRNLWSNIIHGLNDTLAFIAVFLGTIS